MKKAAKQSKTYTVTDGTLVLTLESDGGKWLVVTCPFDPELVTQARNIDEAFVMAYDVKKLLDECRAESARANRKAAAAGKRPGKAAAGGRRRKLVEA